MVMNLNLFLILILILILIYYYNNKYKFNLFYISFLFSIYIFISSLLDLIIFNKSFSNFIHFNSINKDLYVIEELNFISNGLDGMSILFICLTSFIIPTCILYIKDYIIDRNFNFYLICIFLIEYFLLNAFSTYDIFFFFIYFEASVIPMFLIIVFWGSRSRKIKASFYLVMYATISSFFFIISIVVILSNIGSLNLIILRNFDFDFNLQLILWIFLFIVFAVKIPIFPFHIWLPEAHVEASTVGSVILASLILKLGSYGVIRVIIPLFPSSCKFFSPLVNSLCFLGILYGSFISIRQIDIKKIIAYSSVVHMNFLIIGLFSFNSISYIGSIFMMLAHGITSSALFFLAGILYDRFKSRIVFYYSGLVFIMPIFSFFFFFFFFSNLGFPGTSNFIGELLILFGILNYSFFLFILSIFVFFLAIIYSIWLPNRVIFGNLRYYGFSYDLDEREFSVLILYFFLSLFLGFFPSKFLSILYVFYPFI